jgi:protein-S-isoprenylcysteine O-methyltransferase Ste14
MAVVQAAVLGVISRRPEWTRAWIYVTSLFLAQAVTGALIHRRFPDLMRERARIQPGSKRWDKQLVSAILLLTLAISVVAAWDVRSNWPPPVSLGWTIFGFALCAAGFWLTYRAMATNRFFSALVRIQKDRGHTVCDRGPYAVARHPGYIGMSLFTIGTPLALGSWASVIPAAMTVSVLVARTALEDRTLRAELEGYADYARRVSYRLVPGVW